MKKILKRILIVLLIVAIFALYGEYFGFPWMKIIARNKIENYLKNTFTTEMIINKVYYRFYTHNYNATVSPINNMDIKFTVYVGGYMFESSDKDWIMHDYFTNYWEYQAKDSLTQNLNELSDNNAIINMRILPYSELYKKYEQFADNVPNYDELKEELSEYLNITLFFPYDFPENSQDEYTKLYNIMKIAEKKTPFGEISFFYNRKFLSTIVTNEQYTNKIIKINSPKDLCNYIEQSKDPN